jgi:hypothetical protein
MEVIKLNKENIPRNFKDWEKLKYKKVEIPEYIYSIDSKIPVNISIKQLKNIINKNIETSDTTYIGTIMTISCSDNSENTWYITITDNINNMVYYFEAGVDYLNLLKYFDFNDEETCKKIYKKESLIDKLIKSLKKFEDVLFYIITGGLLVLLINLFVEIIIK